MTPRRLLHSLAALVRADRLDRELDDEIRGHIDLAERDAMARGLSPEDARREARLLFGSIESMKEAHRDHRSVRWLDHLARDLRYGLASLARNPGFTAVTVGVLAIGIGANAAMFSVVDAVLLKPLPFPAPEQIVRVWEAPRPGTTNATSTLDFLDWKRLGTSFEALAAENPLRAAWTGHGDPVRLTGNRVTSDYFRVFGTHASLGRTFTPRDDRPGAAPVVVISHATWQTQFGGDPAILNRTMVLDGVTHDIVGVLARGTFDASGAAFWKPLVFAPDQMRRDWHWLSVTGRLRPGVTVSQAREEMKVIDAALSGDAPIWKRDWSIAVEQLDHLLVGDTLRRSILVAFGAVGLVLLIAAANVTNLLLARGVARQKEMAVRAALGASRSRLIAQLLSEGLALCSIGAATGLLVAVLLVALATPLLDGIDPHGAGITLDLRVLGFTGCATLLVALLIGAVPSLTLSIDDLSQALGGTGRGATGARGRVRRAIVVGEVALSLVLVCAAALLFRSLFNLRDVDTGVRIDDVITATVDLPASHYATPRSIAAFYERSIAEIESVPGVERAAASTYLPLQWIGAGEALFVAGSEKPLGVRLKRASPGYFGALDIPVLAGRGITAQDRAGTQPIIVVNEALARALQGRGVAMPVGQSARLSLPEGDLDVQIAGVIRSERVAPPGRPDPPVVYVPLAQAPSSGVGLIVRTTVDPAAAVSGIREALRRVDPNLPLGEVATLEQVRENTLAFASRPAWVIGVFAAIAALLASLGIYGVIAHTVSERTREVGIRIALGARPRDVVSQVLRDAMTMVITGLAIGLVAAYAVTGTLESLLFDVEPLDPLAMTMASVSLVVVALIAALVPASRAARVQPLAVLRDQG